MKRWTFREYIITEYTIKAETRKEAKRKRGTGDFEQSSEWVDRISLFPEKEKEPYYVR